MYFIFIIRNTLIYPIIIELPTITFTIELTVSFFIYGTIPKLIKKFNFFFKKHNVVRKICDSITIWTKDNKHIILQT